MNRLVLGLLVLSLAVAGGLSLLASQAPDGLEHSLETHQAGEGQSVMVSPMPDYQAPVHATPVLRRLLAGVTGVLAVFGLVLVLGWALGKVRGVS